MANTKIDRIKFSGSSTTYDIDLPTDATPTISSLTTDTLSVTGTSTLSDVNANTIEATSMNVTSHLDTYNLYCHNESSIVNLTATTLKVTNGSTLSNVTLGGTISGGTISGATVSGGTISGSTLDGCTISAGTELVNGGTILNGTIKDSTLSNCKVGTTPLTIKPRYSSVGSGTEVPVITTNDIGQVTRISTTRVKTGHVFSVTFGSSSPEFEGKVKLKFHAITSTGQSVTKTVTIQSGSSYTSPDHTVFLSISRAEYSGSQPIKPSMTVLAKGFMVSLDDPTAYFPASILADVAIHNLTHHCLLISDCTISDFRFSNQIGPLP